MDYPTQTLTREHGLAAGEIIRASNTVIYQLPTMGIRNVDQDLFSQCVNFGVEINR